MSEHQSVAGGGPERGPSSETRGYVHDTKTSVASPSATGADAGYAESAAGVGRGPGPEAHCQCHGPAEVYPGASWEASGPVAAPPQSPPPAVGIAPGVPYGGAAQGGHGQVPWPPAAQGYPPYAGAGTPPPGYGHGQQTPAAGPIPMPYQAALFSAMPYHGAPYYAAFHDPAAHHPGLGQGPYPGYGPTPHTVHPGAYPSDAFQAMHPGYGQGYGYGQEAAQGAGHGRGASIRDLMTEVANGGNGLSTLSQMLNLDDPDFWKGALVGAAAVLLLTSDRVQGALFGAGSNGTGDAESGE